MDRLLTERSFFKNGTKLIAEESTRYGFIDFFHDALGIMGMRRHQTGTDYAFIRCILGNVVEMIRVNDG